MCFNCFPDNKFNTEELRKVTYPNFLGILGFIPKKTRLLNRETTYVLLVF